MSATGWGERRGGAGRACLCVGGSRRRSEEEGWGGREGGGGGGVGCILLIARCASDVWPPLPHPQPPLPQSCPASASVMLSVCHVVSRPIAQSTHPA